MVIFLEQYTKKKFFFKKEKKYLHETEKCDTLSVQLLFNNNFMGLFDNLLAQTPQANTTPITPVTTPITQEPTVTMPITQETPSIMQESAPITIEEGSPLIIMNEDAPITHTEMTDSILNLASGHMDDTIPSYTAMKSSETPVVATTASPVETPNITSIISESAPAVTTESPVDAVVPETQTEDASFSVLFGSDATPETDTTVQAISAEETPEEPVDSFHFLDEVAETPVVEGTTTIETAETPENTDAFIVASLAKLDDMLAIIDAKKEKHLAQAAEYKTQKEELAEKEKAENTLAREQDTERNRIESLAKLLRKESEKEDTIESSVNTALTGIAVKESVEKAVKTPTRKKPATEKLAA